MVGGIAGDPDGRDLSGGVMVDQVVSTSGRTYTGLAVRRRKALCGPTVSCPPRYGQPAGSRLTDSGSASFPYVGGTPAFTHHADLRAGHPWRVSTVDDVWYSLPIVGPGSPDSSRERAFLRTDGGNTRAPRSREPAGPRPHANDGERRGEDNQQPSVDREVCASRPFATTR